jgi:hypothetical protein
MTAKRKPKKAALVLTDDDRALLSSLPDDERERPKHSALCSKLGCEGRRRNPNRSDN